MKHMEVAIAILQARVIQELKKAVLRKAGVLAPLPARAPAPTIIVVQPTTPSSPPVIT